MRERRHYGVGLAGALSRALSRLARGRTRRAAARIPLSAGPRQASSLQSALEELRPPDAKQAHRLKILVVVSCFPPSKGGVEKTSYDLAMGLAGEGHQVTVVTTSRGREPGHYVESMGPLKVIRYPESRFLFDAPIVPAIAAAALNEDYDVLHVHGMTPSITDLAILFAKFRGKPVVLTYHNDAQETFPGAVARLAAVLYSRLAVPIVRMADVIVCSTHSYAATSPVLKHILGAVTVVPWGVDARRFSPHSQPLPENPEKHVLFVGQLKKYKGVDVLLQSVAKLNAAGYPLVADIVGTGPHGEELKVRAKALGIEGAARFWGPIGDDLLPSFYEGCDVLALPSLDRREAFGVVVLEAFAAGKPVVTTRIPGVSEIASMGNAFLAEPNDADSLAECIVRALSMKGQPSGCSALPPALSARKTLVKYESMLRFAFEGGKSWAYSLSIILTLAALQATGNLDLQSISAGLALIAS